MGGGGLSVLCVLTFDQLLLLKNGRGNTVTICFSCTMTGF